ncbi:MAG: 16S rRNA (guanine(966)-N(2))-methyltransferase RsmD [Pseudomonadales bacterium]|nr:16S rRNA (guanine(966)-N(2))-methyltransferase RsmD [Pseudomonadales bacterium]
MKRRQSPAKSQQSAAKSQFRLIAGQWRGRKLLFPAVEGLRPTPDRVRETLFNWLADDVYDANCLDLFAGSGALGLECLSRGAKSCHFIEANKEASTAINEHLSLLKAQGATLNGLLPATLSRLNNSVFELVFIDPPYAQAQLINECLQQLIQQGNIQAGATAYIENSSHDGTPRLPDGFKLHRQKTAGQVQYSLYHYLPDNV